MSTANYNNLQQPTTGSRISLREVAKRAGVSIATASRTINGAATVKPALAKRVRRVIEEVGYYPNLHARALVGKHNRTFGLVVSETISACFPDFVRTFEDLGAVQDYDTVVTSVADDSKRLELVARRMFERGVDAVAIRACGNASSLIELFKQREIPVVALDGENPQPYLNTVCIDYHHGFRQAVQHLAALGHRSIAFVCGPAHSKTLTRQKAAFEDCMKEIDLQVYPELLIVGDDTVGGGKTATIFLADLARRPSAILCSSDMIAVGVMQQAFELRISVPGDLSIVGFDGIRFAQFTTPPLTTVQIPQGDLATTAFRALCYLSSSHRDFSLDTHAIKPELIIRRSTSASPSRLG